MSPNAISTSRGKSSVAVELDAIVDDAVDRVACRAERAPDAEHVLAKVAQPAPGDLNRLVRDHVLELVDLLVEVVDEIEEALGDLVDEVVHELPDHLADAARLLRRFGSKGCSPGGVFATLTITYVVAITSISW